MLHNLKLHECVPEASQPGQRHSADQEEGRGGAALIEQTAAARLLFPSTPSPLLFFPSPPLSGVAPLAAASAPIPLPAFACASVGPLNSASGAVRDRTGATNSISLRNNFPLPFSSRRPFRADAHTQNILSLLSSLIFYVATRARSLVALELEL